MLLHASVSMLNHVPHCANTQKFLQMKLVYDAIQESAKKLTKPA